MAGFTVSRHRNALLITTLTDLPNAAGATEDNGGLSGVLTAAAILPGRGEATRATDGILAGVVERYSGRCESEGDRSCLVEADVRRYLNAQVSSTRMLVRQSIYLGGEILVSKGILLEPSELWTRGRFPYTASMQR